MESDGFLSDGDLEAPLAAGAGDRLSDWERMDPRRRAAWTATRLEMPSSSEPQKRENKRRLKETASAGSERPVPSGGSSARPDRPAASTSQTGVAPGGRDCVSTGAPQTGNDANAPGGLNVPPEFFSIVSQVMREEIASIFQQRAHPTAGRPLSSHPSSPPPIPPRSPRGPPLVVGEAARGPANAARKRGRSSPLLGPDSSSESDSIDREEEEFLSGEEEEEEVEVGPERSGRFFKPEDYQYLLTKTLAALSINERQEEDDEDADARRGPWGDEEFFPRSSRDQRVFPFPEFFGRQVKAEWAKPMADKHVPGYVKKLYALPSYAKEISQVPLVDAAVIALQSPGLVSEDGKGHLRDPLDRSADFALKKTHKALAMAISGSNMASTVSRAAIVWTRELLQLIPENNRQLAEVANRVLKAVSFTADATLDSLVFSSRAMASSVAARRLLWLRDWPADYRSKAIVAAYPFHGGRLFGDSLDKILVETKNKKKALPGNFRRYGRRPFGNYSFRAQHTLPRFQQRSRGNSHTYTGF